MIRCLSPFRLLCLGLLLVLSLRALQAQPAPKKELSEQVTSQLGKLKGLAESKNYTEIVRLLDGLIPAAAPDSYDLAVLAQIKGQVLLTDAQYGAAVAPLELSLQVGERSGYFDQKTILSTLYALAQLYAQQAADRKDPGEQASFYTQAHAAITRWLALSPKVSAENQYFAASLLYNHGMLDPKHPDLAKITQARAEAEKCLYLDLHPSAQTYVLILAVLQQLGDFAQSADILEELVVREPQNKLYWQQLLGMYYTLAAATKDEREIRRANLRALLTFERAQARGILSTPKDNFSVVALYFNLRQFERASEFLSAGLKDGKIENTRKNWEILSSAFQQMKDTGKAIAALEKAASVFPEDGQLEFVLAQLLYAQNEPEKACSHLESAVAKGHLEKPAQVYLFLAYVGYELKRFDQASRWAKAAEDQPDVKKEDLARLSRAINDAIKERNAAKL